MQIRVEGIGAEHDVGEDALAVGHLDFHEHGAEGHYFDDHASGIAQGELADDGAVGHFAEFVRLDPGQGFGTCGYQGNGQGQQRQRKQIFGQMHVLWFKKSAEVKQNVNRPETKTGWGSTARKGSAPLVCCCSKFDRLPDTQL